MKRRQGNGRRQDSWTPRLAGAAVLVGVLLLLQGAVEQGLISSFLVPRPTDVAASFGWLVREEHLLQRIGITGGETVAAAFLATMIGSLCGFALYRWSEARLAYTSWIVGLNAAPSLLLYPLFLVIAGRSTVTVVILAIISALPPIVLKTCEGLATGRRVWLDVGRSFGLGRVQQFTLIEFPAAVPTMFSGVRIGLINALITVVGVEFLIGYGGLGALIPDLADRFEIAAMYGAIVFIVLLCACCQMIVGQIEQWLRPV